MLSLAGCCGDEKDDLRALGNLSWTGAMMGVEDLGLTGGFVDVLCQSFDGQGEQKESGCHFSATPKPCVDSGGCHCTIKVVYLER